MAVWREQKGVIAEIALTILCILFMLVAFRASLTASMDGIRILWFFSTLLSWICNSLTFYVIGVSLYPYPSSEGASRDDRSASLACSALLFVGLANSVVCRRIPDSYQNLCASYQQLIQMVFVLVLIISPWSFGHRPPFGLLLAALFLLWVVNRRSRLLRASARSRIKDDLLISEYMAKKHGDNQVLNPGYLSGERPIQPEVAITISPGGSHSSHASSKVSSLHRCHAGSISGCNYYIVYGEVSSTTNWALQRVFLKHITNFRKEVRERVGKSIPDLLGAFFHDLQSASTPGAMVSSVIRYDKLVTVEDIWQHIPALPISSTNIDGRDICLSFALFKLLRRRFRWCNLHESGLGKTKDFALQGFLPDPPKATSLDESPNRTSFSESPPRAFNIIEAELSFLFDFFYGNAMHNLRDHLSTFGFIVFTLSLSSVYHNEFRDEHKAQGIHVIASAATIFFMFPLLGICQLNGVNFDSLMVDLLVRICRRRKRSSSSQASTYDRVQDRVLRMLFLFRTIRPPWSHGSGASARQYCLLLHCDSPHSTTTRRKIPIKAKEALVNALRNVESHTKGILSDGQSSLLRNGQHALLSWACRQEYVAEKIIVWHIATTLCHVGYTVQSSGSFAAMLLRPWDVLVPRGRTRREPAEQRIDDDREVATVLSGYCAYLVGFAPELIADDIYATRLVFENARAAASERIEGEGSLAKMRESAKNMTFGSGGEDFAAATELDVVFQGKMLAAQLLSLQDDERWKVLAEVWAELILFISPTDNAAAHLEKLKTGGEFITHIWALLKHSGIPERPSGQLNDSPAYYKYKLLDPLC